MRPSSIADHLVFDIVMVMEVETAARLIRLMAVGLDAKIEHSLLGSVQIIDQDAEMIHRSGDGVILALAERFRISSAIERDIVVIIADMHGSTIVQGCA